MPERSFSSPSYRYGFNGMEKDDEVKGSSGSHYTTHFRQYDPRLGRWFSTDPVVHFDESPYMAFNNNPIVYNDPRGDTPPSEHIEHKVEKGETEETIEEARLESGVLLSKKALIKIKDMFVCMTILGCRFSDFTQFNEANIIQKGQVANKTTNRYEANINKTFLHIMEKYNYSFKISNQQFNIRIKEVFRQFYIYYRINEDVSDRDLKYVKESHRGRFISTQIIPKYKKIGAHSARRSFATMAYLDGGFSKEMVMKFTGHQSVRDFDRYVNLQVEEIDSKRIASFFD